MDENLTDAIVMNLVVNSGEARSMAMEAIQLAQEGKFEEAAGKIADARSTINAAHNSQTELVQKEINNDPVLMSLLMCHGQDYLMTAMVVIDLALLGPQIRYKLADAKKICEPKGVAVDVILMVDYGTMNGKKVVEFALKLLEKK